jgi:trehalose 6-phosphate phosphatase
MSGQHSVIDTNGAETGLPASAAGYAIFFDVDGTLIDIAATPEGVVVPPGLVTDLSRLRESTEGALALVSGRSIETLDQLFAPARFTLVGLHGSQLRGPDGVEMIVPPPPALRAAEPTLAALVGRFPGTQLEDKGGSIGIHFRGAPDAGPEIERRVEELASASEGALTTQKGKMVIELKPAGASKGAAVDELMQEAPFAGRQPIAIGDDITDEEMFAVVNELGGMTIRVGPPDRPTEAGFRIASPQAVRDWLASVK